MNGGRVARSGGFSVQAAVAAAIAAIFLIDLGTPMGLGVPFLYLLVALGAIGAGAETWLLIAIAAVCTALTLVKLALPGMGGVLWLGQGNRLIFLVLLGTAVALELLRRGLEGRLRAARQRFNEQLEKQVAERTADLARLNRELQNEIAERERAEQTVKAYAKRLQGLATRLVEAQEAERKNLATELHDRIGQNLSALNISLSLHLTQLPPEAVPLRARVLDSLGLVERTTELVRGVMEELHPALLDQYGLEVALRWYGEEFSRRTGIAVINQGPELFPRLRSQIETTLFRIVQEALTNVAKHARAGQVLVSLARMPSGIVLTVADDGIGIDSARVGSQVIGSGWGLSITRERAHSIGAELGIDVPPEGGTRITVDVPNGRWEKENEHFGPDRR